MVMHNYLKENNIDYCFLFAYHPGIYKKSGYKNLTLPILYFDTVHNRWNTYVYNGAMVRCRPPQDLHGVINFNGRIY